MNVETTSANFRRAIALASKVIERRSSIPILSMVHCHANGAFQATGTDLDTYLTATVSRVPGAQADFVMQSAQNVAHAIGAAGGGDVAMRFADGKVSVQSGDLAMTAATLPADDFPTDGLREIDRQFTATLSRSNIATLARISDAISSEETRYYLNGVHIKSVGPTTLQLRATDGHRLYFCDIEAPDATGDLGDGVIIPRKAVRLLIDLAKSAADGLALTIGAAAASNRVDSTAPERPRASRMRVTMTERSGTAISLSSKLIDGTFPDVDRVVPQNGGKQVLFKTADLRRALAAVSGHSRDARVAKLTLNEAGSMTISAAYVTIGLSASITIPCAHNAPGFEIGFNGGYLTSIATAAGGDEMVMTMSDPAAPTLVRNPADSAWRGVLMPMRF